jgi:hypothetical protein
MWDQMVTENRKNSIKHYEYSKEYILVCWEFLKKFTNRLFRRFFTPQT